MILRARFVWTAAFGLALFGACSGGDGFTTGSGAADSGAGEAGHDASVTPPGNPDAAHEGGGAGAVATDASDGGALRDAPDASDQSTPIDAASDADGGPAPECTTAADCDDEDPCNGLEPCLEGSCGPAPPPDPGTPCTPQGDAGLALLSDGAPAAYYCIDEKCLLGCTDDVQCDDGDPCTGTEKCDATSHACEPDEALECDDSDDCTEDKCDKEAGCFFPLVDDDSDGHAPDSIACGTDCNDDDVTIYDGAAELCDLKDNDCDTFTDEIAPTWYLDCDDDDFPPSGATSNQNCVEPAPDGSCPSGGWTTTTPDTGTTDCWDADGNVHPYDPSGNNDAWSPDPIAARDPTVDFDYNCDDVEEKRWTNAGVPFLAVCLMSSFGCTGQEGWEGNAPAECGEGAKYTFCKEADSSGPGDLFSCRREHETREQECR